MEAPEYASQAARALRKLRKPNGGGLEGLGPEDATTPPDLTSNRIKESLEATRERFRKIAEGVKEGQENVRAVQEQVLADAEAALRKLAFEGEGAQIDHQQMAGLEAIIIPDGTRPALFVQDDDVDPGVPEASSWAGRISELRAGIAEASRSVGRINSPIGFPHYVGTGFVIANGLIATNRHVLEALVGGPNPQPDGTWRFLKPVTIDFAAEYERDRKREFKVTGVAFAGPDPINRVVHLPNLDLVLLTAEKNNGTEDLPSPLRLSRRLKALEPGSEIYVMGYPARPQDEVGEVLMVVFQDEYFVKRFAPGYVELAPDAVEDGGHRRVFTHDSSTLRGNSGSCVIELRIEGRSAVGLHFGGFRREENYAHAIARIEQILAEHGAVLQNS